jgi:hypothetical protein
MPTAEANYKIRDKRLFLLAAMELLTGDTQISLEGELSATRLSSVPGATGDETEVLKRNSIAPKLDFCVLPLDAGEARAILIALGGTIPRGVLHVQIQRGGKLELRLYDRFSPDVSFFGPSVTLQFLAQLQSEGLLMRLTGRPDQ